MLRRRRGRFVVCKRRETGGGGGGDEEITGDRSSFRLGKLGQIGPGHWKPPGHRFISVQKLLHLLLVLLFLTPRIYSPSNSSKLLFCFVFFFFSI